ncbi:hypothetical protein [Actinomadura sp. 9N407]|uniref:hypothetical protein n=1 Tax=Actinomadura sp. 9N407 TaxID=3375154 RepID=UPI0037B7EB0F
MRPDGDPEPDDYGLPRVDVVVPDDARELDRDVDAYRREERRRRRRERTRKVLGPFGGYGVAIPIIAGALLVALISGALMTVFGPRPAPRPTAALLAPHPSAGPGRVGGYLPEGQVAEIGKERRPKALRELRPGVIGIVPPGCACESMVAALAGPATQFQLNFWLAADRREATIPADETLRGLKALAGTAHTGTPTVIDDTQSLLAGTYGPTAGSIGTGPEGKPGLTAVLVQPDGVVADVIHSPQAGRELTEKIKALG